MATQKRILLVEDDVFLAEVLVGRLKTAGFDVVLSTNGKDGFEKIKTLRPDLVLLDIILPEMNGYQILEAKWNDSSIKEIPVVVVSNSGQPVEIKRATALGVKGYLIKANIDPDEAIAKIKEVLENTPSSTIAGGAAPAPQKTGALSGKTILWVEDDRFLKDIITVRLSGEGCILLHAADEAEAFAILGKEAPQIILLDILLPGADGFEILKKLKADAKTKSIPVILLSNLSQNADIEKGKSLGAEKFLVKSTVTLDEIISEIRGVLTR